MKFLSQDGLAYLWTKIQAKLDALASRITTDETAIAGKVDKVEGKGLSTEDYTTAEKAKLAGVEAGANAYVLPKAKDDTLGGIKVGSNLSIDGDGVLSATATSYTLPIADSDTLGGVKISGGNLSIDSSTGVLSATDTKYLPAVASSSGVGGSDGLMSASDKEKLDGVTVDASFIANSTNPVQSKIIQSALNGKQDSIFTSSANTLAFGTSASATNNGIAIGAGTNATDNGAALGGYSKTSGGGAVGYYARTSLGGSAGELAVSGDGGAVGLNACTSDGFAGGKDAQCEANDTVIDAIQLGSGINATAKTMQVYGYQMMDANGIIPAARLPMDLQVLSYSSNNHWSQYDVAAYGGYCGAGTALHINGVTILTVSAQRSVDTLSGYVNLVQGASKLIHKPANDVKVAITSAEGKALYLKVAAADGMISVGRDDSDSWGASVQTIRATLVFAAS